jgi:hypothetical protein
MSVRLSAHISAAPSGQIYLKFGITGFHENVMRYCRFVYNWEKNIIGFTWRPEYVVLLPVTWSHHESTLLKCLGSLCGTNITWIHHSVTLCVHCISCPNCKFLFPLWTHTGLQDLLSCRRLMLHYDSFYMLPCAILYWYCPVSAIGCHDHMFECV